MKASHSGADSEGASTCDSKGCRRCLCSWNIYWKALVWLCVVVVYMILAEQENERKTMELAHLEREEAIWEFNRTKHAFVEFIANSSNLSYDEVANLTAGVVAVTRRLTQAEQLPTNQNPIWEFGPAIFFATTVMTTIGQLGFSSLGQVHVW